MGHAMTRRQLRLYSRLGCLRYASTEDSQTPFCPPLQGLCLPLCAEGDHR